MAVIWSDESTADVVCWMFPTLFVLPQFSKADQILGAPFYFSRYGLELEQGICNLDLLWDLSPKLPAHNTWARLPCHQIDRIRCASQGCSMTCPRSNQVLHYTWEHQASFTYASSSPRTARSCSYCCQPYSRFTAWAVIKSKCVKISVKDSP